MAYILQIYARGHQKSGDSLLLLRSKNIMIIPIFSVRVVVLLIAFMILKF